MSNFIKINNKTHIQNSQNLNSTFSQIRKEHPPQTIYLQAPLYYNLLTQAELDLPL